jgi:hypothetical protein
MINLPVPILEPRPVFAKAGLTVTGIDLRYRLA